MTNSYAVRPRYRLPANELYKKIWVIFYFGAEVAPIKTIRIMSRTAVFRILGLWAFSPRLQTVALQFSCDTKNSLNHTILVVYSSVKFQDVFQCRCRLAQCGVLIYSTLPAWLLISTCEHYWHTTKLVTNVVDLVSVVLAYSHKGQCK